MYLGTAQQVWKPTKATLSSIPDGAGGIKITLNLMSSLTKQYKKNINIRELAINLTTGLSQKDWAGEVYNCWYFVKNNIRYLRDINGVETIQTPIKTLQYSQGDCDDKSTLLASLLESIGHPTRFVAVGFVPNSFVHVFVETCIGNSWVALETTEDVPMGWSPPGVQSRMVVHN